MGSKGMLRGTAGAFRKHSTVILFLLPAIAILFLVMVYPLSMGIAMSFSRLDLGSFTLSGEGLGNYRKIFSSNEFWRAARNSVIWVFGITLVQFLIGFAAALLLNFDVPGVSVFRILLLLPWTVPIVVVAFNFFWLYHTDFGMIVWIIRRIAARTVLILANPRTALPAVMVASIWWGFPFFMLMLLAGLRTVPAELYDACVVDGANFLQVLRYVIVPWVRPIITIVMILGTIWSLNGFTLVKVMTGGGPNGATDIFGMLIYRRGFAFFHFGEAAAISVVVFCVALVLAFLYIRVMSEKENADA